MLLLSCSRCSDIRLLVYAGISRGFPKLGTCHYRSCTIREDTCQPRSRFPCANNCVPRRFLLRPFRSQLLPRRRWIAQVVHISKMPPKTRPRPMSAFHARGNALLNKQLDSISAILANASKRRDTAAKEVVGRGTSGSSTRMAAVRSPPVRPLVDYLSSSPPRSLFDNPPASPPPCGGSNVVNDSSSGYGGLATTSGAQASPELENGATKHQGISLPSSIAVSCLGSRDVGYRNEDVASMIRELEDMSRPSRTPVEPSGEDTREDLEAMLARLVEMLVPPPKRPTESTVVKMQGAAAYAVGPTLQGTDNDWKREIAISQKDLCYDTALQLEKAGIKWELAQGWTTYLFSAGSRGNVAVREKQQLVKEAKAELGVIIKQVLDEEVAYCEKNILPRRLLLSNIAVGADVDEVALFLSEFKYDIRNIKMLARDPASRTQTALVDMYTKDAAKQASYTMGAIFGLIVKTGLATEGG
ncbi:hypothetical protein PMIN04_001748 [Paraphaeosphaeria minitans]